MAQCGPRRENPDRILPSGEEPLYTASKIRGVPNIVYRMARTPDRKRVVGAWMLYEDVSALLDKTKGWEEPTRPGPPPFEIRSSPGKGRGLFATRKINCGECILQERPILIIPMQVMTFAGYPSAVYPIQERGLLQLLYWLEPEDRKKVLDLHNVYSLSDCGPLLGIVRSNGMGARYFESSACQSYDCLGLMAAMANHSCTPNAHYNATVSDPNILLVAITEIERGEEINISYVDACLPRAERRASLMKDYKFTCTCAACEFPDSTDSDKRRKFVQQSIETLCQRYETWFASKARAESDTTRAFLAHLRSMWDFANKEKVYPFREDIAEKIAWTYLALGDKVNTQKWIAEALRSLWNFDLEELKKRRIRWLQVQRKPESMSAWATRK